MTGDKDNNGVISGINVTPLVDITLVLLIIFMVTAQFVVDTGMKINLPDASSYEVLPKHSIQVSLNVKGETYFMGKKIKHEELKSMISNETKRKPDLKVVVAADENVPYRLVVGTLDEIKKGG